MECAANLAPSEARAVAGHCELDGLATHNAVRTLAPSSLAILCEENYAGRFEGASEATLTGTAV